jgi:general secretion pathway protein D
MHRNWRQAFIAGGVLLLLLAATLPAASKKPPDRAAALYSEGQNAEAREDYESAYKYYLQAWQHKPKNIAYRSAVARMRFQAGAQDVHLGQVLRDQGKLEDALAMFQRAVAIDPSSFVAQQEIRRTRIAMEAAKSAASGEAAPPPQSFEKRLEGAAGVLELQPMSNAPITLKLTEDSKVIYETIGKLAGINVLFDPDYTARRIHVELNGVTIGEALELVALESKTFWRPVTPNTIFVASDTQAKRKELEQNLVKTFYLSNLSQPTELQDVVNTLRTILEVSRLTQVPSQGAIVVRGSPDQVALAEKIINDLDKAKPEVVVDVVVMQVNRDKTKNIGIKLPQTAGVQLQNNINNNNNSTCVPSVTNSCTSTSSTTSNNITLNDIKNLTANDFVVTLDSAAANFLLSDSDTKIIQNPQVRALDGQKASLKIGERVPVATGSFGAGIGSIGVATNSLVNTQFQYLDVGVNIDITPKIHAGREVTLKLTLEISEVDSQENIGGIEQPVIGQRKIEHEIRLKDGESNLLGGLLEESDTKSLAGWPFFSSIPILKYFFSTLNTEKTTNELVFVLTPHIVRGQELSSLNLKPLDVGTAQTIQLRQFGPAAQPKPAKEAPAGGSGPAAGPVKQPAAAPAAAPAPTSVAQPQPASVAQGAPGSAVLASQPGAAPEGAAGPPDASSAPPATPPVVLGFAPASITATVGDTFTMEVTVSGAQNLFSAPMQLQYDPTRLQLVNVSNGNFLEQGQQAVALVKREDAATGTLQLNANRPPNSGGASGQGSVFSLTFMAKDDGQASVAITRASLKDVSNQVLSASGTQATVNIKPKPAPPKEAQAPPNGAGAPPKDAAPPPKDAGAGKKE